jgi:hypothetical protein
MSNATLAPGQGNAGGTLSTGDLRLRSSTTFLVNLSGSAPGQYGQLDVHGTVNLATDNGSGATLNLVPGSSFANPLCQNLTLIRNDGTDPVQGTFAGLPEGAVVTLDALTYHITYMGGDGNDVVLLAPPTGVFFINAANSHLLVYTTAGTLADTGHQAAALALGTDARGEAEAYFLDSTNHLWVYQLGGTATKTSVTATTLFGGGQQEVFYRISNNTLHVYHDNGTTTSSGAVAISVRVGRDANGNDEVFFTNAQGSLFEWRQGKVVALGYTATALAAGHNGQLAFITSTGELFLYQDAASTTAAGTFTDEKVKAHSLSVGLAADGSAEFYFLDSHNKLDVLAGGTVSSAGVTALAVQGGRDGEAAYTDSKGVLHLLGSNGTTLSTAAVAKLFAISADNVGPGAVSDLFYTNANNNLFLFNNAMTKPVSVGAVAKAFAAF